jgi:xylulokinase
VTATDEAILYYGSAGVLPVMKDDGLNAAFKPFPISERGGRVQEGYLYDYPVYSLSVGDGVRWFKDRFGQIETMESAKGKGLNAFARLDKRAESMPAGCDGLVFLPYLLGQRSPVDNPYANGVYFGLRAAHTRDHLYRALLESWGYSVRYGLESMYPQGYHFRRLVATGGGARSRLWRQMVTDISGIPQDYVPDAQGPLGAAYIAGLGIGAFTDFGKLTAEWVKVSESVVPQTPPPDAYAKGYEIFKALHADLNNTFMKHHEILHSSGETINV